MIQNYSLHTHTIGFDGHNTVDEMVTRARDLGWNALGISNHFIVHPEIKRARMYEYAVRGGYANIYSETFDEVISKFLPHYEYLRNLRDKLDINLYLGMEVDFFDTPKWHSGFDRAIQILKPDYIIGSAHFVWYNKNLYNSHDIKNAEPNDRNIILEQYWKNVQGAARSGLFNWLAHIDLMKKVGLGREDYWRDIEQETISVIQDTHSALEVNTGLYKPDIYEPYPSERILKMVADKNIPVLISDDAHRTEQLGRHFDKATDLIQACCIKNIMTAEQAVKKR